jgi:nucleoporin NDC1
MLSALILSQIELVKKLINIYATQPIQFSISNDNELTLVKALEISKFQITQHLAAYDLYLLSDSAYGHRRKEFYALSIPGGHPHNWKNLLQCVLAKIDSFTAELKKDVEYIAKNRNSNASPNNVNIVMTKFFEQKRIIRETNEFNGIRSFITSPIKSEPVKIEEEKRSKLLMSIKNKALSNRFFAFLFGEEESGNLNFLLMQHSQIMIWIIQGIAAIVARSIKEDNYGIIQHDIKKILKSFLHLKAALDKVTSINTIAKDRNLLALKSALRRALYRFVSEFSQFFDDMLLDADDIRQLHGFVNNREL